jgi:putative transcriptional regulator
MAIRVLLSQVLGRQGMTQVELQMKSGLGYSTINELYNGKTKRVTFATLEALCAALDCDVCELIRYVPEKRRR